MGRSLARTRIGATVSARHRFWQAPRVRYSHVPPHIRGAPPHLACDLPLSWLGSAPLLAQSGSARSSGWHLLLCMESESGAPHRHGCRSSRKAAVATADPLACLFSSLAAPSWARAESPAARAYREPGTGSAVAPALVLRP